MALILVPLIAAITAGGPPPVAARRPEPEGVLAGVPLGSLSLASVLQDRPAAGIPAEPAPAAAFGSKGSWRWYVQGGYGIEAGDAENMFGELGGGVGYFIVDDLSLHLELNGLFINQAGDDAFGVNFNLLGRWHFFTRDTWSIYLDAGAGLMASTAEVPGPSTDEPRGGANLNFTPQAGAGVSFEIQPNVRMLTGVRWHHISNARTSDPNPPRDSVLVYAGVSIPF